jgi:hypothetical protein
VSVKSTASRRARAAAAVINPGGAAAGGVDDRATCLAAAKAAAAAQAAAATAAALHAEMEREPAGGSRSPVRRRRQSPSPKRCRGCCGRSMVVQTVYRDSGVGTP